MSKFISQGEIKTHIKEVLNSWSPEDMGRSMEPSELNNAVLCRLKRGEGITRGDWQQVLLSKFPYYVSMFPYYERLLGPILKLRATEDS